MEEPEGRDQNLRATEPRSTEDGGQRARDRRQMTTGFAAPTPCQGRQMPEAFLPICLPAMANSHKLDGLNLFVNFINDSVIADSDSPVIL